MSVYRTNGPLVKLLLRSTVFDPRINYVDTPMQYTTMLTIVKMTYAQIIKTIDVFLKKQIVIVYF